MKSTNVTKATNITIIIKTGTNTLTVTDVINMLLLSIVAKLKVVLLAPM